MLSFETTADIPKIHALILAGGTSSRMGENKAWIDYNGLPQLVWLYRALENLGLKTWISLRESDERLKDMRCCFDLPSLVEKGPMSGVLSVVQEADNDMAWLIIGCDYPLFDEKEIQHLLAERDASALATVFAPDQRIIPFPSIWEPQMLKHLAQDSFETGASLNRSLSSRSDRLHIISPLSPDALQSIDTPEARARTQWAMKRKAE